jgi:DTW domain-containing protein YfiP
MATIQSANAPMRNRMLKTDADPLRCPRCRLHTDLCACALLALVEVATQVLLVTHKLENRKATNTGHLAIQCLKGARLCLRATRRSFFFPAAIRYRCMNGWQPRP